MAESQPQPSEGVSTFWKTTGLLGLVTILVTLLVAFIQHQDGGNSGAPTTTGLPAATASSTGSWAPPALDRPPPGVARYASVDVRPNDGTPGLGSRVLYRGYLIGYKEEEEEAWVVVHAPEGNYTVGRANPGPDGYWQVPRPYFGQTGPGTTVDVLLVAPLDAAASRWLEQNSHKGGDPAWDRSDAKFDPLARQVLARKRATRTR